MKENLKILLEQSRTADDALRKQLDLLKTPSCDDTQTSAIFRHLHDVWSRLITQGLDMRLFLKEVEKDLAVLGQNESAGDLQSDLRLAERNALSELRFVASVQAMMQKALEKMILLLTASAKITSVKRRVVFNKLSKMEFAIDARKRAFDEEHGKDADAGRAREDAVELGMAEQVDLLVDILKLEVADEIVYEAREIFYKQGENEIVATRTAQELLDLAALLL
jgi:hypothetical protein